MTKWDKVRARILSRQSDANIEFDDLIGLLERLGCVCENRGGSHRVCTFAGWDGLLSLQPDKAGKAKAYQVDQVRDFLEENEL